MPAEIDPEWLARTMTICSSPHESVRQVAWEILADVIWPHILVAAAEEQRRSWASASTHMIAEDAAIHVFIKLMERIESVEPQKLFGWVHVVAHDYIVGLGRTREQPFATDDTWDAVTQAVHRDTPRSLSPMEHLQARFKRLSQGELVLLYQRFWLDMSYNQIGDELGISHQAARQRVLKVCEKLRIVLAAAGYDGDESGATTDFG